MTLRELFPRLGARSMHSPRCSQMPARMIRACGYARRALRIAFCFFRRRSSLGGVNQRFLRTVGRMRSFITSLRKRFSNDSWDSPGRNFAGPYPLN